jgi:hypothetical protein
VEKNLKVGKDEEYKIEKIDKGKSIPKEAYATLEIDDDMEKKLAKVCYEQITLIKGCQERKDFLVLEEYCRKRYTMEDLETEWPWPGASKRRTGDTTIAVDRLMPRVRRALLAGHTITIEPEGNNSWENAMKQEKWMNSILKGEMEIEEKFENILYDSIMLNFGVMKNPWERNEEIREQKVMYDSVEELISNYPDALEKYPELITRLQNGEKVYVREAWKDVDEGCRPHWVDPKNMFFPDGTKDENNTWFAAEKLDNIRRDELKRKESIKFYKNVDKLLGEEIDEKEDSDSQKQEQLSKEYEIYECRIKYDINKDGKEEDVVTWIGIPDNKADKDGDEKSIYLRGIRFPYMHKKSYWIIFRGFHHRYGFYKGGMGEKLKSINCAEDRRINQVQNAFDQAVVRATKQVQIPNSPYNPLKHLFYPGANIPVADPNELTEFNFRDIPASSFPLANDNRRAMELLAGFPQAYLSGMPQPQDAEAPAKKTEMMIAEGMESISDVVNHIARGFKNLGYQIQCDYYELLPEESIKWRVNNGFENITKQEMIKKAKFGCKTAIESISAFEKARSNLVLIKNVASHPLLQSNMYAQYLMLKSVISNWSEEWATQVDQLLPPEMVVVLQKQVEQMKAAAAAQQQQEAAGGGGAANAGSIQ